MFRLELSTQIQEISAAYSPLFFAFVSGIFPQWRTGTNVKANWSANEMSVAETEVKHTSQELQMCL